MKEIMQNGYSSWFSGKFNAQGLFNRRKELTWTICECRMSPWPPCWLVYVCWCVSEHDVWQRCLLASCSHSCTGTSDWQGCRFLARIEILVANLQEFAGFNTIRFDTHSIFLELLAKQILHRIFALVALSSNTLPLDFFSFNNYHLLPRAFFSRKLYDLPQCAPGGRGWVHPSKRAFKSISLGPPAPEQSLLSTGQGFTS